MSKLGKKSIIIPESVQLKIEDGKVSCKGKKGELSLNFPSNVKLEQKDNELYVKIDTKKVGFKKDWGLYRSLIANLIKGVDEGFEKKMEISGVGFKAAVQGSKMILNVGFSHTVAISIPKGIDVKVQKSIISLSGIDKQNVGQFAARIKKVKPPEPYKGKGIKYVGEQIIRKEGKKAVASETA